MNEKNAAKTKKVVILSVFLTFFLVCAIFTIAFIDNKSIDKDLVELNLVSKGETIKIAHLTDMHFPRISINLDDFINILIEEDVDIIAITGDLVDMHDSINNSGVYEFIDKLITVAPVYYVSGNHEKANPDNFALFNFIANKTVFLSNTNSVVNIKGKRVSILGLDDNNLYSDTYFSNEGKNADFKLLITHRPENYKSYCDSESNKVLPNLVLAGHAHGGQFRLFNVGFVAPGQGLFPKYDSGLYELSNKVYMFVSRGLGNSGIPFRVNNKPHLPIITVTI